VLEGPSECPHHAYDFTAAEVALQDYMDYRNQSAGHLMAALPQWERAYWNTFGAAEALERQVADDVARQGRMTQHGGRR